MGMTFVTRPFYQLEPVAFTLNTFLLIVLLLIFLDKNNLIVHGIYVVSVSITSFIVTIFICKSTLFILSEYSTSISSIYKISLVSIFVLIFLNPIIYYLKLKYKKNFKNK